MATFLEADEAARRLGVSRATLYAYVSRGLVRSEPQPGTRKRGYHAADIEVLVRRRNARRDPSSVAAKALGMQGLPVLDSALTLIEGERLYYRGQDAVELSLQRSIEDVAALLWGDDFVDAAPPRLTATDLRRLERLPLVARFHAYLAGASAADPGAFHLSPARVREVGARILRGLAGIACGQPASSEPISAVLCRGWGLSARMGRRRLEAALILCADHELNVSAFTARCVASAGANPYRAVIAALSALSGFKHGGQTERVADMLDEGGPAHDMLVARLRRGESVPGFGHPLYDGPDPRGEALLRLARSGTVRDRAFELVEEARELLDQHPNLDFGLVVLARSLGLPPHAPLALFALGRTVGWIAHILEQYAADTLLRPRARYTGPRPDDEQP